MCLDEGHKRWSYFSADVMFDSSMLVWCLTVTYHLWDNQQGRYIWHWGWGTLVCVKFMADSICSTMFNTKGQSARETSLHYWSLGRMQEDWNDVHVLVWRKAVPSCNPPSSSTLRGRGIPNVAVQQMLDPPSDPPSRSHLWNGDPVSLMLVVRPTKTTCQGPLLWRAGSSSGHGTRWLQRWPRGSKSTSHTPGLTCNASSTDDWWLFPHSGLPSHTTDSGLLHWNGRVHLDGWYWLSPWHLGTLRGTQGRRISAPLEGFLGHSWHIPINASQSRYPGSHRSQSLIGPQIQ